jgi:O-antigen polymerase
MLINSLSIPQKRKPVIVWLLALFIGLGISLSSIQNMSSGGRNIESFQSTDNRQGIYAQSFDMIQEKPLTGWGYGNFEAAFLNYYAEKYANGEYKHAVVQNLDHPHNELLLWAVEGGVIPTLLLICFSLYLIYRVFRHLNVKHGLLALGLIIPLSIHANTEYPFYQSISHWLVFSVLIAFLLWLSRPIQTSDNSRVFKLPFFAKSFALLIPLIAIPLLLVNLQAIHQVTKFHKHRANDIRHLEEIIYPGSIWKRFFFDVMTLKLKASMKDKDRAGLQSYIQWGQAFVQHTPRSAIYLNMANAFWTLGAPEQSIKTLERAVYLYPQDKHLQQILNTTKKNWQDFQSKQSIKPSDTKKQPK